MRTAVNSPAAAGYAGGAPPGKGYAVPPDNPFVNRVGYRPEIYTLGHRNALGLAVQPDTGAIWEFSC